ncbi:MAG: hypothetical protein ACTSV2_03410 [Candidatus Thorarchaeota archaeon]
MSLVSTETHKDQAESLFVCPIHGPVKRDYPISFHTAVEIAGAEVDTTESIIRSFRCPQCRQVYAISNIVARDDMLELSTRCSNGHKAVRFVPIKLESEIKNKLLQRVAHCDRCGMPENVVYVEERRKTARIHTSCPTHGISKKDIPIELLPDLKKAVSEIPEDAIVKSMLASTTCSHTLSILEIEPDKNGYRFRLVCPGQSGASLKTLPVTWNEATNEIITRSIFTCEECGLLTHPLDKKKKGKLTEFRIVCPIHGVLKRHVPSDVFSYLAETELKFDRMPSIIRSLSCTRCKLPLSLRDVERKHGLIEFDMECRNSHRTKRFFIPKLERNTLIDIYKNLYRCPECHDQLDLVYTQPFGKETRVVMLCSLHGKYTLDVPPDHAEVMVAAYGEIEADKLRPPEEAPIEEPVREFEPEIEEQETPTYDVNVVRGCEIIGGKFDYKVKVLNDTEYVITNVTVSIVAYPQDCMELGGESVKTISRIEVGGFRSPQFTFYPTKDCVQGKVVATVSYIDFRDQLHTVQVEPYLIRSVCDLLTPSKKTSAEFDLILGDLTKTGQEQTLDWNAQILFTKAEKLLPTKNFHIIDTEERVLGDQFIGTIRGFAVGKYTQKRVAIVFLISGSENGRQSVLNVEALGDDIAMLPTTIDELADTMDSWICLRCGAPLNPEQVEELGTRIPIRCKYCSHTLTLGLYLM